MRYCLAVLLLNAISWGAPASLPLFFEENRGQSAREVRFVARGSNPIFFTDREAVIASASGDVLRIRPEAVKASRIEPLELLPGKSNYLNRVSTVIGVPHYAGICYRSVNPGIDIAYHGRGSELEYDFNVAAGAHPERIRVRLEGAEELHIDTDGNLVVRMRNVTFLQRKPDAWQFTGDTRHRVDVRYRLTAKREVAFMVGAYDHARSLTIDPLIDYVTYLGATATDAFHLGTVPYAIAADSAGSAYITGDANSGQFPGATGTVPSANNTGFIAKLSADGTALVYATYLNLPIGQAIAVDTQGSAYVGGRDYIAKLSPDGSSLAYANSFPTDLGAPVSRLSLDSAGNLYAFGSTYASNLPTTAGAYQATYPGQIGILGPSAAYGFLRKLSPSGTLAYSTYLRDALATPASQLATQYLAVDPVAQNAIVVTSTTPTASGQASATLQRFGATGQASAKTNVANTPIIIEGAATDSAGNLYLSCNGPGFNDQTTIGPNFVLGLDTANSVFAINTVPFSGDLHLDAVGNAYVVGAVRTGDSLPETPTVTQLGVARRVLGFVSIATSPLTFSPITDQIQSTTVDPSGNVYVVLTPGGQIGSPPQIAATPGAYQTMGGGFAVLKADASALATPPAPPFITSTSVTNAASSQSGAIAPGEILAIYGLYLGPPQLVTVSFNSNGVLPTGLAGTSVMIGNQQAPLLYTSATQIAAIVPMSLTGATTLQVEYQGLLSPQMSLPVVTAIPGFFTANASGTGQGAILNQDESVNSVSHPAAPGSIISLFCSGCGLTAPPGVDGAIATSLASLANPYVVMFGNQPSVVQYAGAAPGLVNGAVQINAMIPPGVVGDAVPVSISVAGSPPSPLITVVVH